MKHLTFSAVSLAVLLFTMGATTLDAQDPVGSIEGVITDSTGGAVAAHVKVRNLETDTSRETVAGVDGLFRFAQIRLEGIASPLMHSILPH